MPAAVATLTDLQWGQEARHSEQFPTALRFVIVRICAQVQGVCHAQEQFSVCTEEAAHTIVRIVAQTILVDGGISVGAIRAMAGNER